MIFLSAVILLGILVFVHELGHLLFAKLMNVKVLRFSLGFGPVVAGRKFGETEYVISAVPFGGYVKMLGENPEEDIKEEDRRRAYNVQPVWRRFPILFAGSLFNIGLTYVIFVAFMAYGLPVGIPRLENVAADIEEIQNNSPAQRAGLKAGDRIVSLEDKDVFTWFEMTDIIKKNPGKELALKAVRKGRELEFKVIPEAFKAKDLKGKEIIVGRIGIVGHKNPIDIIETKNPLYAPVKGIEATCKFSVFVLEVVKNIITGKIPFKTVGGPITVLHESGKAAAIGILPYLMFMAFISANLGVINLLPIPALDGGHIFFLFIEAFRRKPFSTRTMVILQNIGIAVIVTLTVFVFYVDIMRFLDDIVKFFETLSRHVAGR